MGNLSNSNISLDFQMTSQKSASSTNVLQTNKNNNNEIKVPLNNENIEEINLDNNEIVYLSETREFLNNLKESLKEIGLSQKDIEKVISGEITIEELMNEIMTETDNTRRRKIMNAQYLKGYNLEFNTIEELEQEAKKVTEKLKNLREEERNLIEVGEKEATEEIINRLKKGQSLENAIKGYTVAWKFIDKDGNIKYLYTEPSEENISSYAAASNISKYEKVSYLDLYGNSESYKELKDLLENQTTLNEKKESINWTNSKEQLFFEKRLLKEIESEKINISNDKKEIEDEIIELEDKKSLYDYALENINYEVNYYMNYIDKYIVKEDFIDKCNISENLKKSLAEILDLTNYEYDSETDTTRMKNGNNVILMTDKMIVDDKESLVAIIGSLINNVEELNNEGILTSEENSNIVISSNYEILGNYQKWATLITDNEKAAFNYVYNTEGYEAAYKYLEEIAENLDHRWVINKQQEDSAWASKHKVLSSVASVAVTPIEGMSAFLHSINSLVTGEKISKTNVYSAGDVYRQQVGSDIAQNYGENWAFVYNTGMSMADSASLIGLNTATGGGASVLLSTTLMGSRAYVYTLNDALDRGMSDGAAIALAFSSAVTESAMESYSLGHLMDLDSHLNKINKDILSKISSKMGNGRLADITKRSIYIMAGAASQGICEGEEEFTTEIVNHIADEMISGDLNAYNLRILEYMDKGYTEEEARNKANEEFSLQLQQAFLGGFASGTLFGAGGSFYSSYEAHQQGKKIAQNILDNNKINRDEMNAQMQNITSKIERYYELLDIKNSEEYQKYINNKLAPYSEEVRSKFDSVEQELDDLENSSIIQCYVLSDPDVQYLLSDSEGDFSAFSMDSLANSLKRIFPNFTESQISEILSVINIVPESQWKELSEPLARARNLDYIEGFVDKNGVINLPSNANQHAALHECMHKASELDHKKVQVGEKLLKVTGILEYYPDGKYTELANESLTDYLASKYSDGKIYGSAYDKSNVLLWCRLDACITKITGNSDALLELYINHNTNFLRDFFKKYCTKGNYDDFALTMENWYMNIDLLESMVESIEKSTNSSPWSKIKNKIRSKIKNNNNNDNNDNKNFETTNNQNSNIDKNENFSNFDNSEKSNITKTEKIDNNLTTDYIFSQLDNVVKTIDNRTGDGRNVLERYVETGNINLITRTDNCRNYVKTLSVDIIKQYLNSSSNVDYISNSQTNKREKTSTNLTTDYIFSQLDNVVKTIDKKTGDGRNVLERYVETGDINLITRTDNCRNYVKTLSIDVIKQYLNSSYNINSTNKVPNKIENKTQFLSMIKDPIDNYDTLDKLVKRYFNPVYLHSDDLYRNFVSIQTKIPKSPPGQTQINNFKNKFTQDKYLVNHQGISFVQIASKNYNCLESNRLYINMDYNDAYDFAIKFANKCEQKGIPFHFKTTPFYLSNYNKFSLNRDESIVIYSANEYLADYVNICEEIKAENPNMQLLKPPIFTSVYDDWIGYGAYKENGKSSYNDVRTLAFTQAMNTVMEKYQNYNMNYIMNNSVLYKQFLKDLYTEIKRVSPKYNINVNNFSL